MIDSYSAALVAGTAGFIGGAIHSIIDFLLAKIEKRKILYGKWFLTFVLNGIIGIMAGVLLSLNPIISFLAGFSGGTIITGIYNNFSKQKVVIKKVKK